MNVKREGDPVNILQVEDNPADIRLTAELLKQVKILNHLATVEDGEEAMDYLQKKGNFSDAITPDLILLDLNLPKLSGTEVLEKIKRDPELRRIPVVILTVSQAERDVVKSYDLNANAYVIKPIDLDKFIGVIKSIENFWLSIVKLPSH